MRERRISKEWIDREEWRRKMKYHAQKDKDVKILILCTQINKISIKLAVFAVRFQQKICK